MHEKYRPVAAVENRRRVENEFSDPQRDSSHSLRPNRSGRLVKQRDQPCIDLEEFPIFQW